MGEGMQGMEGDRGGGRGREAKELQHHVSPASPSLPSPPLFPPHSCHPRLSPQSLPAPSIVPTSLTPHRKESCDPGHKHQIRPARRLRLVASTSCEGCRALKSELSSRNAHRCRCTHDGREQDCLDQGQGGDLALDPEHRCCHLHGWFGSYFSLQLVFKCASRAGLD